MPKLSRNDRSIADNVMVCALDVDRRLDDWNADYKKTMKKLYNINVKRGMLFEEQFGETDITDVLEDMEDAIRGGPKTSRHTIHGAMFHIDFVTMLNGCKLYMRHIPPSLRKFSLNTVYRLYWSMEYQRWTVDSNIYGPERRTFSTLSEAEKFIRNATSQIQ